MRQHYMTTDASFLIPYTDMIEMKERLCPNVRITIELQI